jgi:hypothetical protein
MKLARQKFQENPERSRESAAWKKRTNFLLCGPKLSTAVSLVARQSCYRLAAWQVRWQVACLTSGQSGSNDPPEGTLSNASANESFFFPSFSFDPRPS